MSAILSRWRYWLDYFWLPPLIAIVAAADLREPIWLAYAAAGFAVWTLVEYWTHRTLLHVFFWNGAHEHHHDHPAEYVEAIWWYTPPLFVALFVAAVSFDRLDIFAGFAAGYLWFLTMHHWLHHMDLRERTWLHRYAIWHNRHHKLGNCNYGITTPVWDRVFRTSR